MKFLLSATFFLIMSCSTVKRNYTGLAKVEYLGNESDKTILYFEKDIDPKEFHTSRSIASVENPALSEQIKNKDVYFKNLWGQTKTIASYLGKEHTNSCPAFHQVIVSENVPAQKLRYTKNQKIDNPILYPFLTLKKGSRTLDSEKQGEESFTDYLENHYSDLMRELTEMCDTGVSENFFVFENTIRYFAQQSSKKDVNELLNSYLKIPVFANLYLLDSLKESTVLLSNTERDILRKLEIQWFESYLYKLRSKRDHVLSMR